MLKAVFWGFHGVIINDDDIHPQLIAQLLLSENLRFDLEEYQEMYLGRSDRARLTAILQTRGRFVRDDYLDGLLRKKAEGYGEWLRSQPKLALYAGVDDLLYRIRSKQYVTAIVTGAQRADVEQVLTAAKLTDQFSLVVSASDMPVAASKPAPDSYLAAIDQLNLLNPELALTPQNCLAIESCFAGVEAAKAANIPVVGVAQIYPYHMMQRCATWAVDYLNEIDFDWIAPRYERGSNAATMEEKPAV
ncbi:HAD family phosphatase [Leptolyngbyaceae cyanobacterium CCMR0082]|uniref:HAD family phosphatase n=1 Tax=Adonisia turfae CCMR0082 TaxID=2304604 RepID=A0A6M0SHE8_9CYAN|nr:HAD family phosphatase [Adonisia turfae]MDV3350835.1 HAD family phosphatase [Leptothoe sp. LEGE 181152]NEZ67969.1 HAD family phosphatase [Adonisia turfae CCMR0082]